MLSTFDTGLVHTGRKPKQSRPRRCDRNHKSIHFSCQCVTVEQLLVVTPEMWVTDTETLRMYLFLPPPPRKQIRSGTLTISCPTFFGKLCCISAHLSVCFFSLPLHCGQSRILLGEPPARKCGGKNYFVSVCRKVSILAKCTIILVLSPTM